MKRDDAAAAVDSAGDADGAGVVDVTSNGDAVYHDDATRVQITTDGEVTISDPSSPRGEGPTAEFSLCDGVLTIHNPAYVPGGDAPEYLSWVVPDEGIVLALGNDTKMFIASNADKTLDVTVVHGDCVARFDRVGSGDAWHVGLNVMGSRTGAEAFVDRWETTHDGARRHGSPTEVWASSMYAPPTAGPLSHNGPKPRSAIPDEGWARQMPTR